MFRRHAHHPAGDGGYTAPRPSEGPMSLAIVVGLVNENRRLRAENERLQSLLDSFMDWTPEDKLRLAYELGRRDERFAATRAERKETNQ